MGETTKLPRRSWRRLVDIARERDMIGGTSDRWSGTVPNGLGKGIGENCILLEMEKDGWEEKREGGEGEGRGQDRR